jgi:hypothetical protein
MEVMRLPSGSRRRPVTAECVTRLRMRVGDQCVPFSV